MRLLLDTHALLWFLAGHRRLSARARRAIENTRSTIFVSAVSGYELAYKQRLGQLEIQLVQQLMDYVRRSGMVEIPVSLLHTLEAGGLPVEHKDPWDRVLVAQARLEDLTLVTKDEVLASYGIRTLW